jgi:hypothetical protein
MYKKRKMAVHPYNTKKIQVLHEVMKQNHKDLEDFFRRFLSRSMSKCS